MDMTKWCIEKHEKTNHYYDTYLPYSFHLNMVMQVGKDFQHLLDNKKDYFSGLTESQTRHDDDFLSFRCTCLRALPGHDLIEDCRVSYGDVRSVLGQGAADIIYAVSNEKGKNRRERANDKYYQGIRECRGAVFVKLCDRIANVQYGKLTKSRMFDMYKKENENFIEKLGYVKDSDNEYEEMFIYLNDLFI